MSDLALDRLPLLRGLKHLLNFCLCHFLLKMRRLEEGGKVS